MDVRPAPIGIGLRASSSVLRRCGRDRLLPRVRVDRWQYPSLGKARRAPYFSRPPQEKGRCTPPTAGLQSEVMATDGTPKPSETSHGGRQVAIVSKLAVPKWPRRERIAWTFAMSSRMLEAGAPSPPPIAAAGLGVLCASIRDTTEAFCHLFLPDREDSTLSPRCLHSIQFMAGTLRDKFPVLLNLILGIRLDLDWTRVAPSPVHGQGVFAKKFIPKEHGSYHVSCRHR